MKSETVDRSEGTLGKAMKKELLREARYASQVKMGQGKDR